MSYGVAARRVAEVSEPSGVAASDTDDHLAKRDAATLKVEATSQLWVLQSFQAEPPHECQ